MKKWKLYSLLSGVLMLFIVTLFVLVGTQEVEAQATAQGGWNITNMATLSWDGGTVTSNVYFTVGTNYGAYWSGLTNMTLVVGTAVTNATTFSNVGNASADYIFTYSKTVSEETVAWVEMFLVGTSTNDVTNITFSPFAQQTVNFLVYVPASEVDAKSNVYQILATNNNAAAAGASNYTGYNSQVYGGKMALYDAPVGGVYLTNATGGATWTIQVVAPELYLAKTIASIENVAPYDGNTTTALPGSRVTLKLAYTNGGSTTAGNVVISDPVNTNYTAFVSGTLKGGAWGDTFAAAANTYSDAMNDDVGGYGVAGAGPTAYFCPSGSATNTLGSIAQNGAGSFFYRLTVN